MTTETVTIKIPNEYASLQNKFFEIAAKHKLNKIQQSESSDKSSNNSLAASTKN